MPTIIVQENAPFDVSLRRFKRACDRAGIPARLKQLEFYEKPTAKRKRRRTSAVKRHEKQLQKEREIIQKGRIRERI